MIIFEQNHTKEENIVPPNLTINQQHGQARLLIESRKYRIRIHKTALHLLDDPNYIELLVNPEKREIAIRRCSHEEPLSHKVDWDRMTVKRCYEIYSKNFVSTIYTVFQIPKKETSFHLSGYLVPGEQLIVFPLTELKEKSGVMEDIHAKM